MAGKDKYVAYVSSYTSGLGSKFGIKIYDVDMKNGRFKEKQKVEITNSSYIGIPIRWAAQVPSPLWQIWTPCNSLVPP